MAKKYYLVSESAYSKLFSNEPEASSVRPTSEAPKAEIPFEEPQSTETFDINVLPRPIRHKSKVIIHHLAPHIKITPEGRVTYPDKSTGSHLYTLLTYFLLPFNRKARPLDAPKFITLVQKYVPDIVVTSTTESTQESKTEAKKQKNNFKWKRSR